MLMVLIVPVKLDSVYDPEGAKCVTLTNANLNVA